MDLQKMFSPLLKSIAACRTDKTNYAMKIITLNKKLKNFIFA